MKFLNKISTQVKIFFGALIGIISFIGFLFIKQKIKLKDEMKYKLEKLKSDINLANLEADSEQKKQKIESLKKEEILIREKIKYIEEKEIVEKREVSLQELDDFFKKRGF